MQISQEGPGRGFPIMVPYRHFLAYMQMLEVTLLKPCFVDYSFPSFTSPQALAGDPSSTVQPCLSAAIVLFSHRP